MMFLKEMMSATMGEMEKVLTTKTVIGEPVQMGNVTLIPVVDLAFGFGAGGGEGSQQGNSGNGGGGGGGAKLTAKAVIVIKEGEVTVLPLAKGSAIEKIVEAIPALLEKVNCAKPEKKEEKE